MSRLSHGLGQSRHETRELLAELEQPRYEIIPMDGVEQQLDFLPFGATVSVTCSKNNGIDATLELSEVLVGRNRDFEVIPHLAARMVKSEAHLNQILLRMNEAGIQGAFVVGGDAELKEGYPYKGSLELAQAINQRDPLIELGGTGYPEGHDDIDDDVLREDLLAKQDYISYVVTQMCFDADAVDTWVGDMQAAGMTVPVKAGVPGIVSVSKLLRVANKVGVGDSVSFFKKNIWTTLQLFVSGQQKQTNLVGELTQFLGDDTHNLSGFHIYSFNEVEATEQWRQTAAAYERGETDMEPGQRRVISLIIDSLCDKLER